jgi:hypothetical protein
LEFKKFIKKIEFFFWDLDFFLDPEDVDVDNDDEEALTA